MHLGNGLATFKSLQTFTFNLQKLRIKKKICVFELFSCKEIDDEGFKHIGRGLANIQALQSFNLKFDS